MLDGESDRIIGWREKQRLAHEGPYQAWLRTLDFILNAVGSH